MTQPGAGDGGQNDAPWTADLRGLGLDEETLGKVDGYMREKVQPHTTKLEQDLAELRENELPEGARQFWDDLSQDPDAALRQLMGEVFSENENAGEILEVAFNYLNENPDASPEAVLEAAEESVGDGGGQPFNPEDYEVELDPEDRQVLDAFKAQQDEEAFSEDAEALREAHPEHFPAEWDLEKVKDVIAPYIAAAPDELDDEEALEYAYAQYASTWALVNGGDDPAAAAQAAAGLSPEQVAAIEAAPPTLGGGPGQNASVPSQKEYGSIGEAVADFAADLRAKNQAAPPTV